MSFKVFKIIRMLISMAIGITVALAISLQNFYIALSAILIGIIALIVIKRNVKDVMVDEMIKAIAFRSASIAYSTSVVILALFSLVFVFANLDNQESFYYQLGIIFSYIALFNMAVYSIAYYFYRSKYVADDK